jgi:DNA-binding cell septation regulator SpoVG
MVEEISSVFVNPLTGFGNLKAMASLNFKGVILRGLRLIEKDESFWLGMPSRKKGERWEDYYFFPDGDTRKRVLDAIIDKYRTEFKD